MALIAAGRRLPVLRDLSALALRRDGAAVSAGSFLQWSSSSGSAKDADSASSGAKGVAGEKSSSVPTEPASTAAPSDQPTTATTPEQTSQPTTVEDDGEWTEVVHSSGQVYYWNQRTGETTQLGEPKPQGRSGSGGSGAGGGAAGGGFGAGGAASGHDPRAEAPLEDRTGTYAGMGLVIGAFLGWVSQFV